MKLSKLLFITSLSVVFALSACKKDKDNTPLFNQSFTSSNGVTVEMTWSTGAHTNGEAYIDLDILADDTTVGSLSTYEANSSHGTGTESFNMSNVMADGSYLLGVLFYEYETSGGLTSGDANYTIKIYPQGSPSSAVSVTGTITGDKVGNHKTYNKYKLVKSGTNYTVQEISPVVARANGY